jgi:hypothetical protein
MMLFLVSVAIIAILLALGYAFLYFLASSMKD